TTAPPTRSQTLPRDHQAQYLAGLIQAWQAHKNESVERWNYLLHLSQTLPERGMSEQQRMQAKQMAHSLAGTLGTFGLMEGYRLALQIQQLLQPASAILPKQIAQFRALVTTLGHALDHPPQLVNGAEETPHGAKLLIVDINQAPYIQQLMALAVAQGFTPEVAASTDSALQILSVPAPKSGEPTSPLPDLVLVNLVGGEADPILDETSSQILLKFITTLSQRWPQLPTVLITPQADFGNRLDLVRRGSAMVLEYPVSPKEVLEAIIQTTYLSYRHSKIMLVDDDSLYLQQLVQLLQPWHFQITPLANSKRFWTLFTQTMPDVIVLDIEMPGVNGFELCKVLRSHPRWQHVPIIFLSVHGDPDSQSRAFAVGADDYITKPIQGQNLVFRILNRLKRYHAWRAQESIASA
ncbi:MAG: response regulator, partial [Cyanobacteria bacterium P01_D01_bin.2]